jgi:hypothetical protein
MRTTSPFISALALVAWMASPTLAAQQFRYIGRATAAAAQNGSVTADVGAGGKDKKGNVIEEKLCDARETTCFNETATAGAVPGVIITGTATTTGGAPTAADRPPGFPRVESTAQASLVVLNPALQIAISPTRAIADSFTGELSAVGGPALVNLGGNDISPPPGQDVVVPGQFTLFPMSSTKTNRNGLTEITVEGAIFEPDPNGPYAQVGEVILGRAVAGIEEPFTEGGGGGGGTCSIPHGSTDSGGLELLAVIGILWAIARRRTSH